MNLSDQQIGIIAQIAHGALNTYRLSIGEAPHPDWEALPGTDKAWMVADTIALVQRVIDGTTPQIEHETWMELRSAKGWTYGPVRDDVTKKNPALVPWDALPAAYQGLSVSQIFAIHGAIGAATYSP